MSKIRTSGQVIVVTHDPHYRETEGADPAINEGLDSGEYLALEAVLQDDNELHSYVDVLSGIIKEYGEIDTTGIVTLLRGYGFPVDSAPIVFVDVPGMD